MRVGSFFRLLTVFRCSTIVHADDQAGIPPFHLKAELAPSRSAENNPELTGTIELWWVWPTKWRREVGSPDFHQVAIVDGKREWQKNDGDYFPEWLRNLSTD